MADTEINRSLAESADRIRQLMEEKETLVEALRDVIDNSDTNPGQHLNLIRLLSYVSFAVHPNWFDLTYSKMSPGSQEDSVAVSTSSQSRRESSIGLDHAAVRGAGERTALAYFGLPGHHGVLPHVVDLNHGAGMTGHIGQMSEMSWMQCVREHLFDHLRVADSHQILLQDNLPSLQAFDLTYFMDDENLLSINEDHVVAEQLPAAEVALMLSEAYFHAMQGAFQFIQREEFLSQLDSLLTRTEHTSWAQRRTLSLVNVVWAVGAKWLQITQLRGQDSVDDHLTYYARARALGLDHRIMFEHPNVEMTQAIGILGFYLLINGSIQRSVCQSDVSLYIVTVSDS